MSSRSVSLITVLLVTLLQGCGGGTLGTGAQKFSGEEISLKPSSLFDLSATSDLSENLTPLCEVKIKGRIVKLTLHFDVGTSTLAGESQADCFAALTPEVGRVTVETSVDDKETHPRYLRTEVQRCGSSTWEPFKSSNEGAGSIKKGEVVLLRWPNWQRDQAYRVYLDLGSGLKESVVYEFKRDGQSACLVNNNKK